jgi:hypothetical protein
MSQICKKMIWEENYGAIIESTYYYTNDFNRISKRKVIPCTSMLF